MFYTYAIKGFKSVEEFYSMNHYAQTLKSHSYQSRVYKN